ncbi:uncharacterized protein [Aegilops tauschii subsp. strangulata]|uniref:KIB1-4 beta-propeller domain-containing protein n=3 Tax=Triticinae TaxID=1648030 RepID=A0A453M1A8_AEGTS|nr:uncharacterized protein LOC109746672 [Aegilops tauschii subsp. strangulata]XP_044399546.1 uncharacterized protein LOC123123151 [Triticum aestivum]
MAGTSGAQISSRRAADRPRALPDPRRPCPSSNIRSHAQSAGRKRKYSVAIDVDPVRDWANIGDGPAGLIAELALASDVADYIRFRAVCQPWRRCSPDPCAGGLDGRFLPRKWIMLDKALAGPRRHRFLNVSTGECIRLDLPELAEHTLLALTPEGLLLLLVEPTLVVRLLNPLTRQLTDLPPVTALLRPEQHRSRQCGSQIGQTINVSGVGLVADASMVAVNFSDPRGLVAAKPGDESWTMVDKEYMNSGLPFAGRFYCANYRGVMVLTTSLDQQPPRLRLVADQSDSFDFSRMADSLHLVDNAGELMLVHRALSLDGEYARSYDAYRVDLEAGVLAPAKGFNGRAVFMGMFRSISVPAEAAYPSVAADSIYLGHDCDRQIQGYNIADGSRCSLIEAVYPRSIVDCLRCCIQGVGKQLA